MAKTDAGHEEKIGLVETTDPEIDKPIFRRPGFAGIDQLGKMDERISVSPEGVATPVSPGRKWRGFSDFRRKCSVAMRKRYRSCM